MPPVTVAEIRAILNDKGFALVNDLTEEERSELYAESYNLFYFDTETPEGEQLKFIIATAPDRTYRQANDWFIDTIIDPKEPLEEINNLDPANFDLFTIESVVFPIRPFYVIEKGMSSWSDTPQFVKSIVDRVVEVAQDELDRTDFAFLNDLFPFLGFPKTRLGQLFGWQDGETITVDLEEVIINTDDGKGQGYKLTFPTAHYILDRIGD